MPVMTKPGTVLLSCEPFVYAAALHQHAEKCDTCLYTATRRDFLGPIPLPRCGACLAVNYCSKACQKKGWKDGHKYECHGLKHNAVPGDVWAKLLIRTLVKLQDGKEHFDVVKTVKGETKQGFMDLISHSEDIKKDGDKMKQIESIISIAKAYLEKSPTKINIPGEAELFEICCRVHFNTLLIKIDLNTVGGAVYLNGLICGHSCDPTGVMEFEGTRMAIRSIKEIPEGTTIDKVTVAFCNTIMPSENRRWILKLDYYFDCHCERCTTELYDKEMRSIICSKDGCENEIDTKDLCQPCGTCGNIKTDEEVDKIRKVEAFISFESTDTLLNLSLLEQNNFSKGHWLILRMYYKMLQGNYVNETMLPQAYFYGCNYLDGIRRYLHPHHEEIALISAKLACMAVLQNKPQEAEEHKNRAKAILEITRDVNSTWHTRFFPKLERDIKKRGAMQTFMLMGGI